MDIQGPIEDPDKDRRGHTNIQRQLTHFKNRLDRFGQESLFPDEKDTILDKDEVKSTTSSQKRKNQISAWMTEDKLSYEKQLEM